MKTNKRLEPLNITAEEWLYSSASKPEKIELGLARCKTVLQRLNLAHPDFKIITVAGTNGKGSTVHFLNSLLRHECYSVGKFTSPHLIKFNERIVVNDEQVEDSVLVQAFEVITAAAGDIQLTYFEYATLAAIYVFALNAVDVAVLEVGLGGRLDASNSVDADVAVITNISLDHQDWLGSDLNGIAKEKAGVMRFQKPVILAEAQMPDGLFQVAKAVEARVYQLGKEYILHHDSNLSVWQLADTDQLKRFTLPIDYTFTDFQQHNLSAAIAAVVVAGFRISQVSVNHAVQEGLPLGRMQVLSKGQSQWLLDVAHNPASMQGLCSRLDRLLTADDSSINVVFGMLSDKDVVGCIKLLAKRNIHWYVAPLDSPRSLTQEGLKLAFINAGVNVAAVQFYPEISTACKQVENDAMGNGYPIVVCGSFYTVADALKYLEHS